jgi:succinoglycan biosynthesis protein ExoM
MKKASHICICVCTYRRPELLGRLLSHVADQEVDDAFDYSVVIVDNDHLGSARQTVDIWSKRSEFSIRYYVEPEQNIALARNKAVENAKGDFVAFIDDDEYPSKDWLLNLHNTFQTYQVDGVLGPVKPYFETEPPRWITRGHLCERESFPTGTIIRNANSLRTGNVLLSSNIFNDADNWFDSAFGRTGGEDGDFFRRMLEKKKSFVWCNEAYVSEIVPPERFSRSYFILKAFLKGMAYANSKKLSLFSKDALISVIAIVLYTIALPVLALRHDLLMKYVIKHCYHLSKILTLCGVKVVKRRTD